MARGRYLSLEEARKTGRGSICQGDNRVSAYGYERTFGWAVI